MIPDESSAVGSEEGSCERLYVPARPSLVVPRILATVSTATSFAFASNAAFCSGVRVSGVPGCFSGPFMVVT